MAAFGSDLGPGYFCTQRRCRRRRLGLSPVGPGPVLSTRIGIYYGYPPGAPSLEVSLARLDMVDAAQESLLGALQVGLAALWGGRRGLLAASLVLLASTCSGSIASSMANSQMPKILFLTWTQAWLLRFDRCGGRLSGWALVLFLGFAYLCRPTALLWAPLALFIWSSRSGMLYPVP